MRNLIGKTVIAAYTKDGNVFLDTSHGIFKLEPSGDCCASCYIQHVAGSGAFPGTIAEIRDVDSSTKADDYDNGDVSESWGHLFVTDKGHCTFEMRVDHNGYYGGSLECYKVEAIPTNSKELDDF